MTEVIEVVVPAALDGMRADRVVAMLADVTRARAADLVAAGLVTVGGATLSARSRPLAAGATLRIELPSADATGVAADPSVRFAVVYEDSEVLVVDKPADLVVHPGAGHLEGTLVSGLLWRYPDLAGLAGICDPERPGIVHRLDRGTSGLLAVARTEVAYHSLVEQLAQRSVTRRYLALAEGIIAEDRGVIEAPIGRSLRQPTRMAVSGAGRPARTRYSVLQRREGRVPSTLLSLSLDTGRTHQIRVHLAAIGHPVVGDPRYGATGATPSMPPGRLFLHAAELRFEHPTTPSTVSCSSPLPGDLVAAGQARGVTPPRGLP